MGEEDACKVELLAVVVAVVAVGAVADVGVLGEDTGVSRGDVVVCTVVVLVVSSLLNSSVDGGVAAAFGLGFAFGFGFDLGAGVAFGFDEAIGCVPRGDTDPPGGVVPIPQSGCQMFLV